METDAEGIRRSIALLKLTQIAWSFAKLLNNSGVVRRQSFKHVSKKSLWIARTLSIVFTAWREWEMFTSECILKNW